MPVLSVRRLGFTLIELLVVIAILGILAAAVLIAINPAKRAAQSRDSIRKQDLASIYNALIAYSVEHGVFPTLSAGSDFVMMSDETDWLAELASDLKKVPIDPKQSFLPTMKFGVGNVEASGGEVLSSFNNPVLDNSSGPEFGYGSALIWNHQVSAVPGENTLLLVMISARGAGSVQSVSYGSQSLTRHATQSLGSGPTLVEVWYLKQPPQGNHEVNLQWNGFAPADGILVGATSWKYVDQDNPLGSATEVQMTSDAISIDVNSASSDDVIVDIGAKPVGAEVDPQIGDAQTELFGQTEGTMIGFSSYRSAADGVEMSWGTPGLTDTWNIIGVPIKSSSYLPVFTIPTPADDIAEDNCPSIEGDQYLYCYAVSETGGNFTIWGRLEIEEDPDIWYQVGAKCRRTPPSIFYNYCVGI